MSVRRGLVAVLVAASLGAVAPAVSQDRTVVAVDSYPLAYFAERLGGDAVEVLFSVPEGRDPAFWRPGIAEIIAIQEADVILLNGADFAAWTTKASLPRSRVVDTSREFSDRYIAKASLTHSHGVEGEHSHTGTASFTWLDLGQAELQAEAVAGSLKRRLPEASADIDRAMEALRADFATIQETAGTLATLTEGRDVIVSHPRYQYLARAYGFSTIDLQWDAGAMPDDAQWQELKDIVAVADSPVFVWEAAPPKAARERMSELGLADTVFPTLAARPEEGDFISTFAEAIDSLKQTLDQPD